MNKSKKLIRDTIIYTIALFGSKLVSFLLLPLYTSYFTSNEYGNWDLITTTVSLIMPFISFEVLSAVYRWLLETKDKEERKDIISTGFIYTIRNILIFNILVVIALNMFDISQGIVALIMINLSILSDFIQMCVRGCGYNKQFALIGVAQTIVTLLSNLFFILLLHTRLETFFYVSMLSSIVGIIVGWYTLKFHQYVSINKYSRKILKSFLKYSVPMIPAAINWWIMNASDRYIIALGLGASANGIYAVSNKLPTIISIVNSIFFMAWQDNAILGYKDKNRDIYYTNVFKYYFRLMATMCILLISSNRIMMRVIVNSQFIEAWKYTSLLYIGAIFSAFSSFWGAGYHGSKQTNVILKTTLIGAIVNILINSSFIKVIGMYSAAISTVMGFFTMWIMRIFNKNASFKIKVNKRDFIVLILLMILTLSCSYYESLLIDCILIFVAIVIFIIFNLDIIRRISELIKKKFIVQKENQVI